MDFEVERIYFLKNQFWASTISASFARAKVYSEEPAKPVTDKEKINFKKELFVFIDDLVSKHYSQQVVDENTHIAHIKSIQKHILESEHKAILANETLRFGIAQKLLNLYLKYLWCAKLIEPKPPHFPLDRLIQGKNIEENWTSLTCTVKYRNLINKLAKEEHKADWELFTYNELLRNV